MTKDKIDFDGLIADCNSILEDRNPHFTEQTLIECVRALTSAKAQSEAVEKFDVLEHLRNGGKVTDGETLFYLHDNQLVGGYHPEHSKGEMAHNIIATAMIFNKLFKGNWQPYEEPPLPQPEEGKFYLVFHDRPSEYVIRVLYRQNNSWRQYEDGTAVYSDSAVEPLRNPETNELYEITAPQLKGGE